ncbi:MAG: hypothetical protein ACE5E1_06510 [Phycisphaerae bacterium]
MLRRLATVAFMLVFAVCISGCNEPETKTTHRVESTSESTPTDTSPGEMIVD